MTAPDPAFVVQQQVFPPGPPPADTITVYDGADAVKNGFKPWRAWDLRGWVRQLVWDLMRFRKLSEGKQDPTIQHGLYDWVLFTAYTTQQNNAILRKLAEVGKVDISSITGQ